MPTYEYKCGACQHRFEQFQSMKDKALKKCPSCGKAKLERLIGTGAAIIFKGSGFYQTDYRSEAYKTAQKADKAESAPAGSGSAASGSETASKTGEASATKGAGEAAIASKCADKTSTSGTQESAATKPPASSDSGASNGTTKSGKGARGKPKD